jgi:hypothetical protein
MLAAQFLDEHDQAGPVTSNMGKMLNTFEYGAALNRGEYVRATINDPFFTMVTPAIGQTRSFFNTSRTTPPVNIRSRMVWSPHKFASPWVNHALVYARPIGGSGDEMTVEFYAVDYASWYLNAGDAGGHAYKGSIRQVISQVVARYGGGNLSAEVRTKTKDNEHNIWHQCRMDPKQFLMSIFDWSPAVTDKLTQWYIYPDSEADQPKVLFVEQADMNSLKRATYLYAGRAPGEKGRVGDILEWEMLANNSLGLFGQHIVTAGVSSMSGAYYDKTTPDHGKTVRIGDDETSNKLKPKTTEKNAFTKPNPNSKPLDATYVSSIPEVPELGLKYGDYVTGRARRVYLALQQHLHTCRVRVMGHHIWATSEGLGSDTIEIRMGTPKGLPHFLQGNWIVMGFLHTMTRDNWYTDLFLSRLDWDAAARTVG